MQIRVYFRYFWDTSGIGKFRAVFLAIFTDDQLSCCFAFLTGCVPRFSVRKVGVVQSSLKQFHENFVDTAYQSPNPNPTPRPDSVCPSKRAIM